MRRDRVYQSVAAIAVTLFLGLSPVRAEDGSRFYTVIDEKGHMRTLERPQQPVAAAAAPEKASEFPVDPVTTLDGEKYVDSGYLQKREFNLEGKKRFYTLPNGVGGTQVLERVPGATDGVSVMGEVAQAPKPVQTPLITLSEGYQRVPAADISPLLGMRCLPPVVLKQAKILHNQPLNLWPRSDTPSLSDKVSLNYLLVDMQARARDLSLQSFAPLGLVSDYYWPLVVFFDEQGCMLEGVNAFYQKTLPKTMLQQSSLVGTLHVPDQSRYVLLTPLVEATDLPRIRLAQVGQLRLVPLR